MSMSPSPHTEPSWCRTTAGDTAEGTFRWTIDNFKNRAEEAGECLKSTTFTVNGPDELKTKWELEVFPKGRTDNEDFLSLYLSSIDDFKVTAKYDLHVIDEAGMERQTHKGEAYEYDDTNGKYKSWGWDMWLKSAEFEDNPDLLPDGNLTLKCKVTVFGTERVLSGTDKDAGNSDLLFARCQKQLSEHFGNLFIDKQLSDVKIECEGRTFDCHQAILATRSPVFMAMFQSNMKEKDTKIVTIDDFKAEVVSEMLNFIYTGNVSDKDIGELGTELLAAADKYQLDLLKNICEERLCSKLKVTNCVEYLVVGDMNQTLKLRRMALKLAAENVDTIIDTDVFKDLFKHEPELAWEITKTLGKK